MQPDRDRRRINTSLGRQTLSAAYFFHSSLSLFVVSDLDPTSSPLPPFSLPLVADGFRFSPTDLVAPPIQVAWDVFPSPLPLNLPPSPFFVIFISATSLFRGFSFPHFLGRRNLTWDGDAPRFFSSFYHCSVFLDALPRLFPELVPPPLLECPHYIQKRERPFHSASSSHHGEFLSLPFTQAGVLAASPSECLYFFPSNQIVESERVQSILLISIKPPFPCDSDHCLVAGFFFCHPLFLWQLSPLSPPPPFLIDSRNEPRECASRLPVRPIVLRVPCSPFPFLQPAHLDSSYAFPCNTLFPPGSRGNATVG